MSDVAPATASSAAIAPTPATPTTTPTAVGDEKSEANKSTTTTTTNPENEMTERNVPVNDPPVTGASSMQMPPLVVKQRGVTKPGAQPTAGSVSFDYTGPPVKVTNGTVMDLVSQFAVQNAWLAVLKLRGFNVTKESAEAILPIKRFRDRVRKLKQTAETLKSRSDDSATFFAKEFVCALNTGGTDSGSSNAKTNPQTGNNQKESSSTDAVIESILRQAATEANSTNAAPAKPKRKKNNTQKQTGAAGQSNAGPGSSHPNSTIDDVVSSVMNKIRNNEPFEGEDRNNGEVSFANVELPFNSVQQQPHQQMVFAPHLQPGQTIYMVQDESMIPLIQQQQQQQQQITQLPPPAASPFKGKAKGRKSKAATAAAAAAAAAQPSGSQIPQQQVVQMPNYLQQQPISQAIRSPTSQSMPQQVTVLTVPRNQNGAGNTSYSIPAGYSTAKFDNNTTVIFSNINDLIRAQQGPAINNQQNQMAKVVTYQPGMTLPPGATIMSQPHPGMSPQAYQQILTQQHHPQQSMQPQYVVTQTPALQQSSSPPKPQPQAAGADEKAGDSSNKKSPRRKSIKTAKREDVALSNFNDSDFEELATPKRKDALKKAVPKKEKKEPAEKKIKPALPSAPATGAPKAPAKKGRKRKAEAESEHEEEEPEHTEVDSSDVDENKSQLEKEVAQLKRQLQAERSRHYTQKRRATKLDDDYKRVLDRLQQTELNLALQMSECERLQAELKKMGDENDTLTAAKSEGNEAPKNAAKPTRPASKRASAINKKRASPSPSPTPGTSQKKAPKGKTATPSKASTTAAAATSTASTSSPPTNNRKRGRPAANATTEATETKQPSPSPPSASEEDKPAFNPNDFIPRRAAAAKRIRYF